MVLFLFTIFYLESHRPFASTLLGIGEFPDNSHAETPFLILWSENEGVKHGSFISWRVHPPRPFIAAGVALICTFFFRTHAFYNPLSRLLPVL